MKIRSSFISNSSSSSFCLIGWKFTPKEISEHPNLQGVGDSYIKGYILSDHDADESTVNNIPLEKLIEILREAVKYASEKNLPPASLFTGTVWS